MFKSYSEIKCSSLSGHIEIFVIFQVLVIYCISIDDFDQTVQKIKASFSRYESQKMDKMTHGLNLNS